jgi:hypothetical protein
VSQEGTGKKGTPLGKNASTLVKNTVLGALRRLLVKQYWGEINVEDNQRFNLNGETPGK